MKRYRVERATFVAEVEVPAGEPAGSSATYPWKRGDLSSLLRQSAIARQYPMGDLNRADQFGSQNQREA